MSEREKSLTFFLFSVFIFLINERADDEVRKQNKRFISTVFPLSFTANLIDMKDYIYLKTVSSSSKISEEKVKTVIHRLVLDKIFELNEITNKALREIAK